MDKSNKISDKTLIPLSLAILAIGGGATWLTDVHGEVAHQKVRIEEITSDSRTINQKLNDILGQIIELRTELHLKRQR